MKLSPLSCKRIDLTKSRVAAGEMVRRITATLNVQLVQPWDIAEVNEGRIVWIGGFDRADWDSAIGHFEAKGWTFRDGDEGSNVVRVFPSDDERKRLRIEAG